MSSVGLRRRAALGISLLGLALAIWPGCQRPPTTHLLMVSIDTLRADHTSLQGYERNTTPNLVEIARSGASFDVAYAPSSTTAPSHASLFTSLYPATHLVVRNGIPLGPEYHTLAERLAEEGYQTAAFVSSYTLHRTFGFEQGFQTYDDDFGPEPPHITLERRGRPGGAGTRRGDDTTDRALHWLREERGPERPFFLFLHYFDPHAPYTPPEHWVGAFGPDDGPELEAQIRSYDAEVAFTDEQLGRLSIALRELDLERDTLLVITADHGEGLMDHGWMDHGLYLFEGFVRVPLVMRWPGQIEPGIRFDAPVTLLDVSPTVLELLRLSVPDELKGQSLVAALRGREALDPDRAIFLNRRHYDEGEVGGIYVNGEQAGVRRGVWKYLEAPKERTAALYNLRGNPAETVDMRAMAPGVARELAQLVRDWHESNVRTIREPPPLSDGQRALLEELGYFE